MKNVRFPMPECLRNNKSIDWQTNFKWFVIGQQTGRVL